MSTTINGYMQRRAQRVDTMLLCSMAGDALKAAGFELRVVSQKSEACYYALPGRYGLLRVATHHNGHGSIGIDQTIATLTFRGGRKYRTHMMMSDHHFELLVNVAIGQYVRRSMTPKQSDYQGPRGTWGHEHGISA